MLQHEQSLHIYPFFFENMTSIDHFYNHLWPELERTNQSLITHSGMYVNLVNLPSLGDRRSDLREFRYPSTASITSATACSAVAATKRC